MITSPVQRRRVRQFAAVLESVAGADAQVPGMARLAASFGSVGTIAGPGEDFRVALRERLLAAGAASAVDRRPVAAAAWRRRLVAAGAVLTIATGGVAATAVASTSALPGDRLYDVKRGVEDVQLALATGDLAKGERYLAIANTRLREVQALLLRNSGQTDNPVLVQELRAALSAMSEAITNGTERFFAAYTHTTNSAVLAPLGEFVDRRTGALGDVRALLPVELLPKQDSLMGELQGIAARVATATGHSAPAGVERSAQAAPVAAVPATVAHASRTHAGRDDLNHLSSLSRTVNPVDATVEQARRDAVATTAAQRQPRHQLDVERNMRHLVEADLLEPEGNARFEGAWEDSEYSGDQSMNAGEWRSADDAGLGSNSVMRLLGMLPAATESIDTSVPGSLTAGLDFGPH